MDAVKHELLLEIGNLKSELRSQDVINQKLTAELLLKHNEAEALSSQLSNITWKITQADFILNHEKERHEKNLEKMENSKLLLNGSSKPDNSDGETLLDKFNEVIKELEGEKDKIYCQMQDLQKFNNEAKISIVNSKQVVTILKKKNSAIMLKLQNRLKEAKNEKKALNTRLNQLQEKYLEKFTESKIFNVVAKT